MNEIRIQFQYGPSLGNLRIFNYKATTQAIGFHAGTITVLTERFVADHLAGNIPEILHIVNISWTKGQDGID